MPDDKGTETTRSDAPSADESLFGEAVNGTKTAVADEQDANEETEQEPQGADDTEAQDGGPEDLKVVVSIKGGRATIGVQQPSSDPHIETFDDPDLSGLAQEVSAVIERARARWEDDVAHRSILLTRGPLPRPGVKPVVGRRLRRPGPPREGQTSSNPRRYGCSRSPRLGWSSRRLGAARRGAGRRGVR